MEGSLQQQGVVGGTDEVPQGTATDGLEPAVLDVATLKGRLRQAAATVTPSIFKRGARESLQYLQNMGIVVPDWADIRMAQQARALASVPVFAAHRAKNVKGRGSSHYYHDAHGGWQPSMPPYQGSGAMSGGAGVSGNTGSSGGAGGAGGGHHNNGSVAAGAAGGGVNSSLLLGGAGSGGGQGGGSFQAPKLSRAVKGKANGAGRQYTSKFRGVHQTFPTRRWEAQFRRSGKPTSLGCFDHEEEAARAYDKMMLWCELHNTAGVKGGITNYDPSEYDKDIPWLQSISQDELIEGLRSDGRRQAAHRMMRAKRESAPNTGRSSKRANTGRQQQQQANGSAQQQQHEGAYGTGQLGGMDVEPVAAGSDLPMGVATAGRARRRSASAGPDSVGAGPGGSPRGTPGSEEMESQV